MRKIALSILLAFPLLAAGAGWDYYVLNEDGEWERASRFDLELSLPKKTGAAGSDQRVMIIYNRFEDKPEASKAKSWIREVDPALVQEVE